LAPGFSTLTGAAAFTLLAGAALAEGFAFLATGLPLFAAGLAALAVFAVADFFAVAMLLQFLVGWVKRCGF
jgi:hypothetical protein